MQRVTPRAGRTPPRAPARPAAVKSAAAPVAPPRPEDLIATQRARRQRIVDTALEFLLENEYDEIQIRDVADRAEVALGTVYRYFASKEHLFAAVLVKWGESFRHQVRRAPLKGSDPAEQILEVYLRIIDGFERLPQFYRLMVVIENTNDPHAHELYRQFADSTTTSMREPLDRFSEKDSAAINSVFSSVLDSGLRSWVNGTIDLDTARNRLREAVRIIFSPAPKASRSSR